jgi:hypothetical protein
VVCFLQFVGDTRGQYFFNVVVVVAVVQIGAVQMVGMLQCLIKSNIEKSERSYWSCQSNIQEKDEKKLRGSIQHLKLNKHVFV